MKNILGAILPFLLVLLIMPFIMKFAVKIGFTDKPTKRKQHRGNIPLCGGVPVYIVFFIFYFLLVRDSDIDKLLIFIGGTLILLIGLVDDYFKTIGKEFPIFPRLVVQLFSAGLAYKAGIVFLGFSNPFTDSYILLPTIIQFLVTIIWIFGVTTVINWSDGMDGLAGGISLVSAITFFLSALILKQDISALNSIILASSIGGFLIFNKYPAKVFMGDSGANFIGYMLSIIAIDGAFKQSTVFSLFIPILALAVPIFDNIFVIIKRFSEGKPVYQADRSQMHYRLEEKGLTPPQIVKNIILISIICSAIAIITILIKH